MRGEITQNTRVELKHTDVFAWRSIELAQLHADLFSCHANPLEVYVFLAVANRGEDIVSDEICRRFNGNEQYRRRSGRIVCSSQTGL